MELLSSAPEIGERKLSRRTVVAGIAWSVPVIAVATATPAYAASQPPGPVVVLPTTWSRTGTGTLTQSGATGFLPTGSTAGHATSSYLTGSPVANSFTSGSDTNGSAATITALYTFNAVKGGKYTVGLKVLTQYGTYNNSTSYSERQSLDATIVQGSATTTLAKVSVSHSNTCTRSNTTMTRAGYTLQTPSQGTKDYTATFTAPADGAVTIRCVFTLDARYSSLLRTNRVNDDMWISAPTVSKLA